MNNTRLFAARVRESRDQKRLSKSALARAVGVSTTCVWNWEEGNTYPRADALSRLAAALSTTVEFLERGGAPQAQHRETSAIDSATAPPTRASLAEIILRAREEIALASGLSVEQVKVVLEYGA